jgi:NADH dehydrogenase
VDGEGNQNLIRAAEEAGVKHFVLISARGAAPHHPMELMRKKFVAEQELKRSRLARTIIRPAPFMETWAKVIGEKAIVFGRGDNPINFVSVHDVARLVEKAVIEPRQSGIEVDACGPENLTLNQLASTFDAVTGRPHGRRHVPLVALRLLGALVSPINPAIARMARDAVLMDTLDFRSNSSQSGTGDSGAQTFLIDALKRDYAAERGLQTKIASVRSSATDPNNRVTTPDARRTPGRPTRSG